jgi:restriction endonuclease Mrr
MDGLVKGKRLAKESAARARGTIVLVDGALLSSLMMDHGVAVSHKALRIPKVDNDYFEEVCRAFGNAFYALRR